MKKLLWLLAIGLFFSGTAPADKSIKVFLYYTKPVTLYFSPHVNDHLHDDLVYRQPKEGDTLWVILTVDKVNNGLLRASDFGVANDIFGQTPFSSGYRWIKPSAVNVALKPGTTIYSKPSKRDKFISADTIPYQPEASLLDLHSDWVKVSFTRDSVTVIGWTQFNSVCVPPLQNCKSQ